MGERLKLDWLKKEQRQFLEKGYLQNGQTPEERYLKIAATIENIALQQSSSTEAILYCGGLSHRFKGYIEKGWISFATPVLSNFGERDNLPISCNHGIIGDSLTSILGELHSVGMLAKYGAGTAKNFSRLRSIGSTISTGGKSESIIKWIELYADMMSKVAQNGVRRGYFTAYLKVSHPEIMQFLEIGGKGSKTQDVTTAVTIPKGWMQELEDGSKEHRKVWAAIHKCRAEKGFPYILFEENCNKNSPQVYIDKGLWIDNGNICIEALEYADETKEFACCLSSVNAYYYDDWKDDPNFVFDVNLMLDCVIEEYIQKGKDLPGLEKAIRFAKEHRAIGVGVLGFHSYLQKNMIVWGSIPCYRVNNEMFSLIRRESDRASRWMAKKWGEPEMMRGYGLRNSSNTAQAPTKSTSFIMGNLSQGIEPIKSNYNEMDRAKIQVEYKNPELVKLFERKNLGNCKEIWRSILEHNGSVQHLSILTQEEKDVFKTFYEISQMDVINLAAQRQKHINMGQSINLMIHPKTPPKDVNKLVLHAYKEGIKSLYYQYSISAAQEFNKELATQCSSCEA